MASLGVGAIWVGLFVICVGLHFAFIEESETFWTLLPFRMLFVLLFASPPISMICFALTLRDDRARGPRIRGVSSIKLGSLSLHALIMGLSIWMIAELIVNGVA